VRILGLREAGTMFVDDREPVKKGEDLPAKQVRDVP
jgi:hypothetical protein